MHSPDVFQACQSAAYGTGGLDAPWIQGTSRLKAPSDLMGCDMRSSASTQITRSALVPFGAAQMYRLVADVATYPQFLPWCTQADVRHDNAHSALASLTIAKGPLRKRLTTRNLLFPDRRIEMALVDGPFHHLNGCWSFDDLGGEGARITLIMDFEIAGGLLRRAVQPIFAEIANTMVAAFCRRAHDLYGP